LLSILQALSRVASKFPEFDSPEAVGFKSPVLNEAIFSLPTIATDVVTFLSTFNHREAADDNKFDMFREDDPKFEAIYEHKMAISAIEADLDEHLLEIRKMLKHSKLVYVTVAGIEVSNRIVCDLTLTGSIWSSYGMRMLRGSPRIGSK
jgi:DNA mismatch repair protein MSH3